MTTHDARDVDVDVDVALDVGVVVAGRYRLTRRIGRGAMGVVYEVEHVTVGRRMALKVLSHEWAGDPSMGQRFRAEARNASAAGHPNIVEVFDAGELPDGRPYLVLELLEGREVYEILVAEGSLEIPRACRIVRLVARALHAAHQVGVIHRDLKPENVFIVDPIDGAEEGVKVLDFGIAVMSDAPAARMTRPGVAVGTPEYMAPEQAYGQSPAPSFDVYAIGVLLFELLTGLPPFTAESPLTIIRQKATHDAPRLDESRPDVPTDLADFVAACLAREPDDRPPTAAAVADALAEIERDLENGGVSRVPAADASGAISVPPEAPPEPTPPRVSTWVLAAAVVSIIGTGAAVGMVVGSDEPRPLATLDGTVVMSGAVPPVPGSFALPHIDLASGETEAVADTEGLAEEPKATARVVETPASRPEKTPSRDPDSAECGQRRRQATSAREHHDWEGVLRYTARGRRCWDSAGEVLGLRVLALSELGRFDACIREGRGSDDSRVHRTVALCKKRSGVQ